MQNGFHIQRITPAIIAAVCLIVVATPSRAQWIKTNGPCGRSGEVSSICTYGSTIFAGSDAGVYASKDGGNSWLNINPQLLVEPYLVRCFAVAVSGQTLFACMGPNGLFASTDEGEHWTPAGNGIPSYLGITKMAVSGSRIIASTPYLFETTDNGETWTWIDSSRTTIVSLIAQDNFVFAGTWGGILRSSDYGATWTQVYSTSVAPVYAIAKSGDRVFAGVANSVIGSTDDGTTWNADSSLLNCTIVRSLIASPAGSANSYLFAGTDSGIFRSSDNGITWTRRNPVPNTSLILTLAFRKDETSGNVALLAGTGAGIYSSTDDGNTWSPLGLPQGTWYMSASGTNLFAGSTSMPYVTLGAGAGTTIGYDNRCVVYRSNDYGLTWGEVDQGLIDHPDVVLCSLAASPAMAGGFSLFVGATASYIAGNSPVYASSDLGATWVNVIPDSAGAEFPTIGVDSSVVVVGTTGYGMFRSTDRGLSWTEHDSGIAVPPPQGFTHSTVNAFSIDGTKLYAAGGYYVPGHQTVFYNYIMVSTDFGVRWSRIDSSFMPRAAETGLYDTISVIKCIYGTGPNLIVGTQAWDRGITDPSGYPLQLWGGGIYHLVYDGVDWTLKDSALIGEQVSSIVSSGSYIFAAAAGSGVYRSGNDGSTWQNISEGLTDGSVSALLVLDPYLFAATSSGVWRRPLSEIASVSSGATGAKVPERCNLAQNYPNPFNPSTNISFSLAVRSFVTIKIFDVLGRELSTIVSGELQAGSYSCQWNASAFASGVYFYRMQAGNFVQTRKLLMVK